MSFLQFHPELNPIERCWGRAKKYARSNCNYSFPSLQAIVPQALAVVSIELIIGPTWMGKQQWMQWMRSRRINLTGEFQTLRIRYI